MLLLLLRFIEIPVINANRADPDQTSPPVFCVASVHISRLNLSLSFLFDLYIGSCDYVKDVYLGQDILNYWTYSSDGLHLLTSHPYMTLPYISRSTDFVKICFKSISQKLLVLQPVILDICTFYHGLFSAVIHN